MSEITAKHIGKVLGQAASLLELLGENHFSVRSMQSASRHFQRLNVPLEQALQEISSGKARGFGKGLREYVSEVSSTGSLDLIDELQAQLPSDLPDLLQIPGLGGKKVRTLWKELDITSLDELEAACQDGRVAELKGFAQKTVENILQGIEKLRSYSSKLRSDQAAALADEICAALAAAKCCGKIEVVGEIRRCCEVVSQTVFLLETHQQDGVISALQKLDSLADVKASGKKSITASYGAHPVILELTTEQDWFSELVKQTGSSRHLEMLGNLDKSSKADSEEGIYAALSLAFIPPELREGQGEIESARQMFKTGDSWNLVEASDLRGIIHAHTTYSDGAHSLREMAEAVRSAGYQYFAVSDHSQTAAYAGGLSPQQIVQQQKEIAALNKEFAPFKIFSGIESDILEDGSLDYDDKVLESFDFVIASVHSRFGLSEAEMTKRITRAVQNKFTTILGHPTGRLLLKREAYEVDLKQVIDACAESGTAIEINAQPKRLDLDWRLLEYALKQGVRIAVCPDAHSTADIDLVKYGVATARKGGLSKDDVVNCMTLKNFEGYIQGAKAK